ncbi:centromere protein C isoform X2 [Vigna unguiculata]|uniref:centromere protein C isoform X2 n=1 Tax=Vigna unguiculata TaxID=3917 RepID=UPI00101629A7|nr:centromere protein C isoform X2 [Vigna unguiculata]
MEKEGDALVDPLANYWGLSLFTSPSLLPPSQPYNSDLDLQTIHTHLKSMALRSPAKLVQGAKSVLDDNPNLFGSEITQDSIFQTTNGAAEDGEFRRQQRPGLGLKRPRFSMKPTKTPSVESLLPTLDLDSLKDPAEFFSAHERLENAKREIQKQLGGASFEYDQNSLSTRPRERRPGLLGNDQLPIKYKHRYPRETSESVLSSQDTLGSQTLDLVAERTDIDEAYVLSSKKKVMDSSATKGNKLDELLDGLLSCNSEDLEGDGAISLLQERLQIKPVAVDKFSVPIFPDSQVTDLKSLQGKKSKPRKALSDIDNLLRGMNTNKKTPIKKSTQITVQQLSSPTPPRSPFASILSLQKHISMSRQPMDHFSLNEIGMENSEHNLVPGRPNELNAHLIKDVVVAKTSTVSDTDRNYTNPSGNSKEDNSRKSLNELNASSAEDIIGVGGTSGAKETVTNGTSTSHVGGSGMGKMVGTEDKSNIEPNMIADVVAVDNTSTVLDTDINCTHASDISKEESSEKSSNELIASSIEDITAVGGISLAEDTARNCTSTPQKSIEDNSREPKSVNNVDSYEPLVHMDVDVGGSDMGERVMHDIEDRLNIEANESCQSEDNAGNMQPFTTSIRTDDANLNMDNPLADQSDLAGYQANAVDKRARRSEDDQSNPTGYQADIVQEKTDASMQPVKKQKRVKSRAPTNVSKRQSLAASGTSWNSGVRRSSRIRTRPLEYWKGERPVYGRIHQSLATVIGVKCISPGSDGKPTMKVKSYVSDQHKELFELASSY